MLELHLRQLETFVATVEQASFTRAAAELYLTQSTVSVHIATLEEILGERLLVRGARKQLVLTEKGKVVYEEAREIVNRCKALEDIEEWGQHDPLSIGASTVPSAYVLPAILSGFGRKHRDIQYQLKRGDSVRVHKLLEQGTVRIGFVGAALDRQNCIYQPLIRDRLVLIAPNTPFYREKKATGVSGMTLLDEPMIVREPDSGTRRAVETYLRQNGISPETLQVVAEMEHPETIKRSVWEGLGVSILSHLAVQTEVQTGTLLTFDLNPKSVYRQIYAVWRKDLVLRRIEHAFLRFIKAEVQRKHQREME